MDFLQLLVLALVQGVTEFLPISSSAHLILVPALTGWTDQGLMIDVALHVGTLAAVTGYFWRESLAMAGGGFSLLRGQLDHGGRLLLQVALGTLPVVLAGLLVQGLVSDWRNPLLIAATTIFFGLLLYAADKMGRREARIEAMTWRDALLIGLAQCLALVPGTSRSGITMTAALALGYQRGDAARFSLLLSIPTTLAAGLLIGWKLRETGDLELQRDALIAAALAFVAAWIAIGGMMAWLRHASFTPFVVYRLALGFFLLAWLYL